MVIVGLRTILPKMTALDRNLADCVDEAVRTTAFKVQQRAVEILTETVYAHNKQPTPTGALRASIYTRTYKSGNYRDKMLKATSLRAAAKRDRDEENQGRAVTKIDLISPEVDKPPKGQAWVAVGMAYGIYIEYPTRGRPGTYYMAGAVKDTRIFFLKQVKEAIIRAGQPEAAAKYDTLIDYLVAQESKQAGQGENAS